MAYALRALGSYAATFLGGGPGGGGGDAVLVILGDHQPARLITGETTSREVPVHVVATDPALLAPFRAWGFTDGLVPGPGAAAHRMDRFRGWFLDAFSRPPAGAEAASR